MERGFFPAAACAAVVAVIGTSTVSAGVLDLTAAPYAGDFHGALFQQDYQQPAGSGRFRPFIRISAKGNQPQQEGYNTDARPLEFDEDSAFTRSLRASQIPTTTVENVVYRVFHLDVNEPRGGGHEFISLDKLQIFLGAAGDLAGYPDNLGALIYDLDTAGEDNWIKLESARAGGGQSDMSLLVPDSLFTLAGTPDPYVYLYSRFGDHFAADGGFEEWSTPEPATLGLMLCGWIVASRRRARRVGA